MMTKKRVFWVTFFVLWVVVLSCVIAKESKNNNLPLIETGKLLPTQSICSSLPGNFRVLQENQHYRVVQKSSLYYVFFLDTNGAAARIDGPYSRLPHVEEKPNNVIVFTMQAGTGAGTQWGYYYDAQNNIFSDVFQSIFDQNGRLIVCVDPEKVIVRDIFDKNLYYKEFNSFKNGFSNVAEPITNARFINNGMSIEVTYMSGDNYLEIREIFDL